MAPLAHARLVAGWRRESRCMGRSGKTILFSRRDDWEAGMRSALKSHRPHFLEFETVDPERFDLIVPTTLKDARYFNRNFAHLNHSKAIVPSDEAIDACDQKHEFVRRLTACGFSRYLPAWGDGLGYPYLLKKNVSEWGVDIHIIPDAETEIAYRRELQSGDYLKQQYIHGQTEYTTHLLMAAGKNVFMRSVEFGFAESLHVKGKVFQHTSQALVDHLRYSALFEDVMNSLGFQGFCCFNYKLVDGVPKIFEVNPRYGASMTLFLAEAIHRLQRSLRNTRGSGIGRWFSRFYSRV
jgi:hypothetical protein